MTKEPAAGIGVVISLFFTLLWQIMAQYDVAIADGLKTSVEAFIQAILLLPAVAGFLIRFQVTPVDKAEAAIDAERANAQSVVNRAYKAGPSDPKPALEPKTTL